MGTVIKLYHCKKCGWVMDEEETQSPKPCRFCDSRMLGLSAPTFMNIARYVFWHPKTLWLWVKENVFKRNR